jgi:hypothetical protein
MDITTRTKLALENENLELLEQLAQEHNDVMNSLRKTGFTEKVEHVSMIEEILAQIKQIISVIEKDRIILKDKMQINGNKKKLAKAYKNF